MISDELIKIIVDDILETLEVFDCYEPIYNSKSLEEFEHDYDVRMMLENSGISINHKFIMPELDTKEIIMRKEVDANVKKAIEIYYVTHLKEKK
jgi:hypothetical protein